MLSRLSCNLYAMRGGRLLRDNRCAGVMAVAARIETHLHQGPARMSLLTFVFAGVPFVSCPQILSLAPPNPTAWGGQRIAKLLRHTDRLLPPETTEPSGLASVVFVASFPRITVTEALGRV